MSEITIVSAFFNIGRENYAAIPRTDHHYMVAFRTWARINNHLIIYTDQSKAEMIMEIRKEFHLENRTTIIVVNHIEEIEPGIFKRMQEISTDKRFIDYRMIPNATSNIATYSYLMLMKSWFMADAVNRGLASDMVAWIDYGYNHVDELFYIDGIFKDFDFPIGIRADLKDLFLKKLTDDKNTVTIIYNLNRHILF